uniref:Uncharacterized protein n=1 Tax=Myoviridae sp. ctgXL3 TaxID=2826681 RepID=A0A8S5QRM1_9CAUD|nr:MAG TPA: hypothetical protein [Myoviridae sp. ctgXL3]
MGGTYNRPLYKVSFIWCPICDFALKVSAYKRRYLTPIY